MCVCNISNSPLPLQQRRKAMQMPPFFFFSKIMVAICNTLIQSTGRCAAELARGRYAHADSARTEEVTQALPLTVTLFTKGRPQDLIQIHTLSRQWAQGPLQAFPLFQPDQVCSMQFKASMTAPAQRRLVGFTETTIRGLFRTAKESVAVQQWFSNCSAHTPVVLGIQ